jgi:hypothetical protein
MRVKKQRRTAILTKTTVGEQLTDDMKLAAFHAAWTASSGEARDLNLLGALELCGSARPLPEWVFAELCRQQIARLPGIDRNTARWFSVLGARREGLSWKAATNAASNRLKDTFAAGKPDTIWHAYKRVEASRRAAGIRWCDHQRLLPSLVQATRLLQSGAEKSR